MPYVCLHTSSLSSSYQNVFLLLLHPAKPSPSLRQKSFRNLAHAHPTQNCKIMYPSIKLAFKNYILLKMFKFKKFPTIFKQLQQMWCLVYQCRTLKNILNVAQRLDSRHQPFVKYISKLFSNRGKFTSLQFLLELIFSFYFPHIMLH